MKGRIVGAGAILAALVMVMTAFGAGAFCSDADSSDAADCGHHDSSVGVNAVELISLGYRVYINGEIAEIMAEKGVEAGIEAYMSVISIPATATADEIHAALISNNVVEAIAAFLLKECNVGDTGFVFDLELYYVDDGALYPWYSPQTDNFRAQNSKVSE